ncbi:hypothetical protein T440DRAFT_382866 [Plenodomus tracheiphilus IPT5]|uniref:Protein BIG1 n=1 Tax=Plenodomus tracheiphilus IPT5 TaxID=1408161 RepID=A0A6A7BQU8_9PLEO|nr:hypothetical protein T440DRAFT_382866 [Plenodomus tracheiphilus IPT5]
MFFSKSYFLALLLTTITSTVLAAPTIDTREPRLEDVQCRCLSFSTSAKPTLCTYLELHNLDWHTAYAFASDNDLKIQFASKATITKVLSIPKPLPSSVLMSIEGGEAQQAYPYQPQAAQQQQQLGFEDSTASVNKIVCGLGDEVKHLGADVKFSEPELHYVGVVVASFMLFLIVWVVLEYLWTKYFSRGGNIKLEGEEKSLSATYEHVDCSVPTDVS